MTPCHDMGEVTCGALPGGQGVVPGHMALGVSWHTSLVYQVHFVLDTFMFPYFCWKLASVSLASVSHSPPPAPWGPRWWQGHLTTVWTTLGL